MTKLTLVTAAVPNYLHLLSPWVQPHYADAFDTVAYDPGHAYNPNTHAVLISYVELLEQHTWYSALQDQGLRVVVEHLADSDVDTPSSMTHDQLLLRSPNWMWYNASWEWSWYGSDQYTPCRDYQYNFLMPMNLPRWHRDRAVRDLAPVLEQALYSYVSRGRELPGTPPPHIPWRGWLNPDWYNSTPYTVVVESYMRSRYTAANPENYRTEVSEKIFKPMLGQQPFVVYGSVDTLQYLEREGFVSYNNLFDQTYDAVTEDTMRFDCVTQVVKQAVTDYPYRTFKLDTATLERIQHNHARLFDHATVEQRFQAEVVGDILNWWES
jgi:hypothetical protein